MLKEGHSSLGAIATGRLLMSQLIGTHMHMSGSIGFRVIRTGSWEGNGVEELEGGNPVCSG